MGNVEARLKIKGKQFEICVDLDEALKIKNGEGDITSALQSQNIYYDLKKGLVVSQSDLQKYFQTTEIFGVAKKIIILGEVQKTQEYRDEEKERKIKQIIDTLIKNGVDQNGRPFTEDRLKSAIKEINYNFDKSPIEKQLPLLVKKLKEVIPIRIETKRIKLIIPARFTGQTYGLLKHYKENEEWLSNGNLKIILNIPSGTLIDFYEKINDLTHGSVQSEEL